MGQANDPFEKFREQKIAEKLEKKVKSSASVKCPGGGEDAKDRRSECFDPSRNWIY